MITLNSVHDSKYPGFLNDITHVISLFKPKVLFESDEDLELI